MSSSREVSTEAQIAEERVDRSRAAAASQPNVGLIRQIREDLIETVWRGLFLIAVVGVPISLSRSLHTGWMPLYTAHLAIGALAVATFLSRKRLPYAVLVGIMLAMFWAVGLAGAVSLGLLGAGLWWLSMSTLLISVLVSMRWGVVAVLGATAVLCLVAAGFIGGALQLPFDADEYLRLPSSWLTLLVGTTVMPIIVFTAFASYQRATVELLNRIEQQRSEIEHLVTHDHLTGLVTAGVGRDRLEHALAARSRLRRKVGLLFVDLDGFKAINDTYGHAAGDAVLKTVAARMAGAVRLDDTVCRKGGDEFLVVLEGVLDADAALTVGDKLVRVIGQGITHGADVLHVGASVGVALAPDDAIDGDELIRVADAAMYRAKNAGKNRAVLAGAG